MSASLLDPETPHPAFGGRAAFLQGAQEFICAPEQNLA